ncbi:MAG: hypothetical protein ACJ786_24620 [Catenulispora sp.]
MNARLSELCQERLAPRRFADSEPDAAAKIAGIEQVLVRFERSASAHGFVFAPADAFRPAYLGAIYVSQGATTLGRAY